MQNKIGSHRDDPGAECRPPMHKKSLKFDKFSISFPLFFEKSFFLIFFRLNRLTIDDFFITRHLLELKRGKNNQDKIWLKVYQTKTLNFAGFDCEKIILFVCVK